MSFSVFRSPPSRNAQCRPPMVQPNTANLRHDSHLSARRKTDSTRDHTCRNGRASMLLLRLVGVGLVREVDILVFEGEGQVRRRESRSLWWQVSHMLYCHVTRSHDVSSTLLDIGLALIPILRRWEQTGVCVGLGLVFDSEHRQGVGIGHPHLPLTSGASGPPRLL